MQIVIDVTEKEYENIRLMNAIANGVILPKGHGRLIDADAFAKKLEYASKRQKYKELLMLSKN